jgi:hypothetical protein
MKKIKLNSKVRKLNSLVELVGQEVSVDNENEIIQSEVDSIKVTNDEVTLNLESGDQVVMDTEEAEELIETGEVATEVPTEPQDFEVTREVLDEDGIVDTVTSIVEAPTEDEAIQTIQTLDSKRKRNSRNYKATRKENSMPEGKEFKMAIGDDYIARFTTCPMGSLLKLEIKKADETNDKFVEVETSWIGKELSMNDAFTAAEEAIEKLSK